MQSQKYDGRISGKIVKSAKCMDVEMNTARFKHFDPISELSFIHDYKKACDINAIHENSSMSLCQDGMKDHTKAAIKHKDSATKEDASEQERKLKTYCQAVTYLVATYATDDVIAYVEGEITNPKLPEEMPTVHCSKGLWETAWRYVHVCDKPQMKEVFQEGLHEFSRVSMETFWGAHKEATLQNLAR